MDTFLHSYHVLQSNTNIPANLNLNESEMQKIIRNLPKSKPEPLVKFLYIILDKLVDLTINPPIVHNQICTSAASGGKIFESEFVYEF